MAGIGIDSEDRLPSLNSEARPIDREQQPELRPRGHRVEERLSIEDLAEAIRELISAIYELRDMLSLDRWDRTYGSRPDAPAARPVTPLGQRPLDPDLGR